MIKTIINDKLFVYRLKYSLIVLLIFNTMYSVNIWSLDILMKRVENMEYIILTKTGIIGLLLYLIILDINEFNRKVEEMNGIKNLPTKLYK